MDKTNNISVDLNYYTKNYAKKEINKFGWVFYWIGACNFYLSYQVWKAHFYWWHPATWILWLITVIVFGAKNIGEINDDMFMSKSDMVYPYRKAKKINNIPIGTFNFLRMMNDEDTKVK